MRAVKTKRFRLILSALGLFNKIEDWPLLNKLCRKEKICHKIGALYDVAKKIFKVRRMDERTRKSLLNSKIDDKYVVGKVHSKDFKEVERLWKVYVPFNKADLEAYKE